MIIQPDGGYTTAESWTGLVVGLNPQYIHPACMATKLKHSCNNQQFPGGYRFFMSRIFTNMGKTAYRKFLDGNGKGTDVSNESVAQQ